MANYGKTQHSAQTFCVSRVRQIFDSAARHYWTHADMLTARDALFGTAQWKQLNRLGRQFVFGVWHECSRRHEDLIHWRVRLDGALILGSDVPNGRWSDVVTDGGAFVYTANPEHVYQASSSTFPTLTV